MDSKKPVLYGVGIDPGWKNLGLAITKLEDGVLSLVHSETINPSSHGLFPSIDVIWQKICDKTDKPYGAIANVGIERYVSYADVTSSETENILMLIGGLGYLMHVGDKPVGFYRAIDWKTTLVKLLVKNKGFDNPSTSLDKKFSVAAAHACLDIKGEFSNDHEADALCLASIGFLKDRYTNDKTPKTS